MRWWWPWRRKEQQGASVLQQKVYPETPAMERVRRHAERLEQMLDKEAEVLRRQHDDG